MKRYILVAFLAAVALGLSACDKGGDTTQKQTTGKEKGVVEGTLDATKEMAKKAVDKTVDATKKVIGHEKKETDKGDKHKDEHK